MIEREMRCGIGVDNSHFFLYDLFGDERIIMADALSGIVWRNENNYSSGGQTKTVPLQGVTPHAKKLCGEYVCVESEKDLDPKFDSCAPLAANSTVTTNCFNQVFAYYTLDRYVRFLKDDVDFDITAVRARLHKDPDYALPVRVDIDPIDTAFYMSADESINFGNGARKFNYASDGDILVHEASHWIIDMVNPLLSGGFFGAGPAIHEGCADALTALFFGDPQISEDYGFLKSGKGFPNGLRSAQNNNTFTNTQSLDPHIMGKIYGGFFWSVYKMIDDVLKSRNKEKYKEDPDTFRQMARDFTIQLILAHVGSYKVPNPKFGDFPGAIRKALKNLSSGGFLRELKAWDVDYTEMKNIIEGEIAARAFASAPDVEDEVQTTEAAPDKLTFGAAVAMGGFGGEPVAYLPQLYQTKRSGSAFVLGHGAIREGSLADMGGVKAVKPGSIDETINVSKESAYAKAVSAVKTKLPAILAKGVDELKLSEGSRDHMIKQTLSLLEKAGPDGARLAILPNGNKLVWYFEIENTCVAIDAGNGSVVELKFNWMVD